MGHTTNQERLKMSDAKKDFYPFSNEQNWLNFKADQENWSNFKAEVERLNVELDENMGLLESWPIRDVLERIVRESRGKDAEIERLRELVEAGKEDRKEIDVLVDENLRLRELLKGVVDDMVIDDTGNIFGTDQKGGV